MESEDTRAIPYNRKTVSGREKFIRSLKKAGYDVDAGAKKLQDLIARQKQEREKIEQRRKESEVG